jgi:hypothetical protein
MPATTKPRVISEKHTIPVGDPDLTNFATEGSWSALVLSYPNHRLPNGAWSGGREFYTVSEKTKLGTHGFPVTQGSPRRTKSWQLVKIGPSANVATPSYPSFANAYTALKPYAATGYARTRPGNPVASLGQFLIELRDLPQVPFRRLFKSGATFRDLPRLALRELQDFRNLGSEYLNVVFGWKPFVSDLQKMYHLWWNIDKQMAKLIRENGRGIHRKAKLEKGSSVTESSRVVSNNFFDGCIGRPGLIVPAGTAKTTTVSSTRVETEIWYAAKYRYWIPDTSSSLWDARARLALFGALPTPELLWEVLPWSWLIDWFSNVGDVVSNASLNAVDNLVTLYSYTMKKVTTKASWSSHCWLQQKTSGSQLWPTADFTVTSTVEKVEKLRIGNNNPFALGTQLSTLSSGQLAILAALGISRSKVR